MTEIAVVCLFVVVGFALGTKSKLDTEEKFKAELKKGHDYAVTVAQSNLRDIASWRNAHRAYREHSPSSTDLATLTKVMFYDPKTDQPQCRWCNGGCIEPLPSDTPPDILAAFGRQPWTQTCYHGRCDDLNRTGYEFHTLRDLRYQRKIDGLTSHLKLLAAYTDRVENLSRTDRSKLHARLVDALAFLQSLGIYPVAVDPEEEKEKEVA